MSKKRVALVEDELVVRRSLRIFLESRGYAVFEGSSCREAEELFAAEDLDLAILDNRLPDGNAIDFLPRLRAAWPDIPVVILTGYGSIDLAVNAIKLGAEQFLTKPVELDALAMIADRLVIRTQQARLAGSQAQRNANAVDPFVGDSQEITRLKQQARTVANAELAILIQGETGVGKGVLARWLHENSPRRDEAFVNLNCAGLSADFLESELFGHEKGSFTGASTQKKGLFEVAHRGTLFLDEIGDMVPTVQGKILKAIEEKSFRRLGANRERRVDVRLIAATHRGLDELLAGGALREDLYYRIATVQLLFPPLRSRARDVPVLADWLLQQIGARLGRLDLTISAAAAEALAAHAWPGNVRELKNCLERAALFCKTGTIEPEDVLVVPRGGSRPSLDTSMTLEELECLYIDQVMQEEEGRTSRAAKRLGIHRSTLYQKLKRSQRTVSETATESWESRHGS